MATIGVKRFSKRSTRGSREPREVPRVKQQPVFVHDTTASYTVLIGSKMSTNNCNIAFKNCSAMSICIFSHRWQMNLLEQFQLRTFHAANAAFTLGEHGMGSHVISTQHEINSCTITNQLH